MSFLVHLLGLSGLAALAIGFAAGLLNWKESLRWLTRLLFVALGAACAAGLLYVARREFDFRAIVYLSLIGALVVLHSILLFAWLARADWPPPGGEPGTAPHPALARAMAFERALNFSAAVVAYDEYLDENPGDPSARGKLAESLIKAGNAKRAISVLTLAFTGTQDPREQISFGIRLAEVILVAQRDPLAARAQLEQVRKIYAGTEHEKYVEHLARRLLKRVAQGRYLRAKPKRL